MSPFSKIAGRGRQLATAVCALLLVAGITLGVVAVRAQRSAPQVPQTSAAQAEREAAALAPVPAPPSAATSASPSGSASATPSAPPVALPSAVAIPAIGVKSPLQPLGQNKDGSIAVPAGKGLDQAAWYTGSPRPGQVGPAVLEGHVDTKNGPSVFFKLAALKSGETVQVTSQDGKTRTFTVSRVERYAKIDFPTLAVYGNTKAPELRLITCGGVFNRQTGHHLDNTVVYARLTSG